MLRAIISDLESEYKGPFTRILNILVTINGEFA
jgi:hypothetical protein